MQSQTRQVFARQPAHILLVDYQPPFDADISEYVNQSLKDLFALVCNITGPCRTPLFGLFALGTYPESLFQLQYVKNNFPRLHSALDELKFYTKDSNLLTNTKTADILKQGLQDAVTHFKRHSQSLRQISTSSSQLEICVLTCRKASHLSKTIDEVSNSLQLGNIKKIQIAAVEMNDGDEEKQSDGNSRDQSVSPSSSGGTSIQGCGIVDTITLRKDPISFQNFFKTWLLDCETDQEHIRIELPNPFAMEYQGENETEMLVLKCDIHERLLSPAQLPFRSQFEINREHQNVSKVMSNKTSPSVVSYPVHTMSVERLVKTEGICESVIFGMPYIVRSTVCWKLDWEELERNQQYFTALCNVLQDRDLAALIKIKRSSNNAHEDKLPVGYYILLPSDGNSMLLKSIATNELLLPAESHQSVDVPSSEATEAISASLDMFQVDDTFNPVFIKSGLYSSLADLSLRGVKAPVKRGFQAPQKYQQDMSKMSNTSRPVLTKQNRVPKRPVFSKESTSKTTKRSRTAPALNIYVSSPPDLTDEL